MSGPSTVSKAFLLAQAKSRQAEEELCHHAVGRWALNLFSNVSFMVAHASTLLLEFAIGVHLLISGFYLSDARYAPREVLDFFYPGAGKMLIGLHLVLGAAVIGATFIGKYRHTRWYAIILTAVGVIYCVEAGLLWENVKIGLSPKTDFYSALSPLIAVCYVTARVMFGAAYRLEQRRASRSD